ncbi:DNA damage-regulated autophagy modulator protein 2-like [Sitophilus oryzae]|uniref:DNA damage-regulated autophagy modulator protein 2-like n=1 Tax=Sitophilus oryzae TaxID=7048 RepID=A0A6J2YFR8_SITOR|nr:DNA damage-regulated autophagy modulator protein 2-like [Sitophilus oryzae]
MSYLYDKPYIIPICIVVLYIFLLIISYSLAVATRHVYPVFPYVTDLNVVKPESSFFALMFTIIAVLMLIAAYIRYRKVRFVCDNIDFEEKRITYHLNLAQFVDAFIVVIFMIILANSTDSWSYASGVCAGLFFVILMVLDIVISNFIYPAFGNEYVNLFKIGLTVVALILFIMKFTFQSLALERYNGFNSLYWTPHEAGYTVHVMGAICDWLFHIVTIIFFGLFICDFREIKFEEPYVIAKCSTCPEDGMCYIDTNLECK